MHICSGYLQTLNLSLDSNANGSVPLDLSTGQHTGSCSLRTCPCSRYTDTPEWSSHLPPPRPAARGPETRGSPLQRTYWHSNPERKEKCPFLLRRNVETKKEGVTIGTSTQAVLKRPRTLAMVTMCPWFWAFI